MKSIDIKDYTIATIASHSSLQIFKGAKDEGLRTLAVCKKENKQVYDSFGVVDEYIMIDDYHDWNKELEDKLIKKNAILIPHGSLVAYVGPEKIKKTDVMYYGPKDILEWESDRSMERKWLIASGLKLPKVFDDPKDIDRRVIIKFHGAQGGFGYFISNSPEQFYEVKSNKYADEKEFAIQEYVVGVPVYAHYFYSPLTDELEIMSFDKRYESNADSIGRINAEDQLAAKIHTSYTIVGNIPIVIRESLLPQYFEMGRNVVEESKNILKNGQILHGPFCLETIVTRKLEIITFEISARIVAGTNPFIGGSPYTDLKYDVPMSTGRRIALEIKNAIVGGKLDDILS